MTFHQKSMTIDESKQVILSDLPFSAGQKIQVIIVVDESEVSLDENATIDAVMQQYSQEGNWKHQAQRMSVTTNHLLNQQKKSGQRESNSHQ